MAANPVVLYQDACSAGCAHDAVDGSSTGTLSAMDVGAVKAPHESEEPVMQTVTTIGLDIAKSVFQVHGVDAAGQVVVGRQLKRRYVLAFFEKLPPCLIGVEACASSHHWSRELQALGQGAPDASGLREALRKAPDK
jgi:hypothetical protein